MRTIGIVGGLGPEATIEYYRRIPEHVLNLGYRKDAPEIVIYSADLGRLFELMELEDWDGLAEWLVARVNALQSAGVGLAAIASNTPHIVFDEVASLARVPMVSIVEETCQKASGLELRKLGLMGTKFTMHHNFYEKAFHSQGMKIVVPKPQEQIYIHEKLLSEIGLGVIETTTRNELLSIVRRMLKEDLIDGLILGCTELPLILDRDEYGIPFLNTTAIHVEGIVRCCIESH
jgi:aspartate racemase